MLLSVIASVGGGVLSYKVFFANNMYLSLLVVIITLFVAYFMLKAYTKCKNCGECFCIRKTGETIIDESVQTGSKKENGRNARAIYRISIVDIYTKCINCSHESSYQVVRKKEI